MAVNIQKFLPSAASKGGALAKTSQNIAKGSSSLGITESAQKNIGVIRVKVIEIDDILKGTLASQKIQLDNQKRQQSSQRREKQEEKLETKPDAEKGQIKMPKTPRLGIFDWIKNFIGNIILGYFAVRLVDHLPKIIPIVKFIGSATDFLIDVGGNLLNSLVTFIDWGYKAYDATRGFIKNIGGENFAKGFDKFIGAIDTALFLTTALAGSMALEAMSGDDGGGLMDLLGNKLKGAKAAKGVTAVKGASAAKAAGVGAAGAAAIVAGAGLLASALGEGAFQLKKFGNKGVESAKKAYEGEKNWLMKPVRWGGYQLARFANFTLGTIGSLLDIVGAPFRYAIELIRYPFLSDEDKVKQANNLAKFDARIREQFREGLNALTFGLAFKEKGSFGNIFGNKGAQKEMMSKMAGGGRPSTRGGKSISGPSRRIKKTKTKRAISVQPTPIKPGANVGGEKNVEKVFPKSKDKTKTSPLDYVESSYKKISDEPFFGPLMSISTKALVGQKPGKVDYKNAAQGLSNWMNSTFSDEILRTGALYAAGGGEIDAKLLESKSGDMTDAIARSLEDNISRRVDDAINDLMKQMMLKGIEPEDKDGKIGVQSSPDSYESGPAGSSGDALTMARNLMRDLGLTDAQAAGIVGNMIAESGVENARPQNTPPGTKGPLVVDGKTGYGIVQWTSQGRQQKLYDFAKSKGHDMSKPLTMDIEYKFFLKEFRESYGSVLSQIKQARDTKTASTIFMQQYEIPAGYKTEAKIMERYNASRPIYEKLVSGQGKATEGPRESYVVQSPSERRSSGYTPSKPGLFNAIEYITGDRNHSNYELRGHGLPSNYHDHIAFRTIGDKERAKLALRNAGIQIGSELRPGDRGYHGANLAIDIPGYQWGGSGAIGQREFDGSKRVRAVLGLTESRFEKGGKVNGFTRAILGEKGPEFVIDADSTRALEDNFPGFLDALNKANYEGALKVLRTYTDYEMPSPEVVYIPVPISNDTPEDYSSQSSGGLAMFAGGEADDPFKTLYQGT